ncbi:hypothetical protein GWO43_07925 [candidate division KSB1 bacterium]|nr:hypothetical protein [candidate division KSB1 bacterium]NIS23897.1 hypothetical protein [candidate division KSB1 bacterium]NIT70814.1 hypothetical protein [candidate division KSB1 bacterium]NIU24546.1 hypothetical protein [candidate division KSB1 bacterium]NIU94500.1 hypothetical protein [candidate division KSB1 bacterium]
MWFGTEDGLNKYDGYTFTVYKHDPESPKSLSNNEVRSIYEDQSGALWVGTVDGLNKLVPNENEGLSPTSIHYKTNPNNPNSLSNNAIMSIYEDRSGVLWIGTEDGLNKLVPRKNQEAPPTFVHYKNDPDDPNSLSHNVIRSIYEDQSGVLWIGTWGGGLNRFETRLNRRDGSTFTHYKRDPDNSNSLSHNMVRSIYQDQSGVLWIGTEDGLNKCDRKKTKFTHYKNAPDNPNSLNNSVVWSIFEDRSGMLWIGTWGGGLNRFDRKQKIFTHFKHNPTNPYSLSDNVVWSIYEDRSGGLWIGTRKGGLNKFVPSENDGSSPIFIHYKNAPDDPNSLSNNNVRSIYEDHSGMLWIGTHGGGLNRFDPE